MAGPLRPPGCEPLPSGLLLVGPPQHVEELDDDVVVVAVNLNPFEEREGVVVLPAWIGLPPAVRVRELLADEVFTWHIGRNYVRLGPGQSHVLTAERYE